MQFAHLWQLIVAFVMLVMVAPPIYIGSVGMEGAYGVMENGSDDPEKERQNHDLKVEQV